MDKRSQFLDSIRKKRQQQQLLRTLGAKQREGTLKIRRDSRPIPMDINGKPRIVKKIPQQKQRTLLPQLQGVKKTRQQTIKNNRGRTFVLKKPLTKTRVSTCSAVLTMPQTGAICWFNAIFTTLFYSQYTRIVVKKHAQALLRDPTSRTIALAMLEILKGYETRKVSARVIEHMQPHMFLRNLRATRSNLFDSMLNGSEEAHFCPYQQKILGFLHVPHLHIGIINNSFVYSGFNVDLPLDPKLWPKAINTQSPKGTYVDTNKPEVILINRDLGESYLQGIWTVKRPPIGTITGFNPKFHAPVIMYNNVRYILDSCVLGAELHTATCSIGHAIAGVTCNNQRFIYNGWTARSADPAMKGSGTVVSDMPCALMQADWALDRHFCINTSACKMNAARPNQLKKELCFNGVEKSAVVYIRIDIARSAGYKTLGKLVKRRI